MHYCIPHIKPRPSTANRYRRASPFHEFPSPAPWSSWVMSSWLRCDYLNDRTVIFTNYLLLPKEWGLSSETGLRNWSNGIVCRMILVDDLMGPMDDQNQSKIRLLLLWNDPDAVISALLSYCTSHYHIFTFIVPTLVRMLIRTVAPMRRFHELYTVLPHSIFIWRLVYTRISPTVTRAKLFFGTSSAQENTISWQILRNKVWQEIYIVWLEISIVWHFVLYVLGRPSPSTTLPEECPARLFRFTTMLMLHATNVLI